MGEGMGPGVIIPSGPWRPTESQLLRPCNREGARGARHDRQTDDSSITVRFISFGDCCTCLRITISSSVVHDLQ